MADLLLLAATLAVAVVDWYAVGTKNKRLEYVAKPATMVVLFLAGVTLDAHDETVRQWFLIAVVLSLAGDVFLMLEDRNPNLFVAGLGAFLLGHVAYVIGMWSDRQDTLAFTLGVAVVAIAIAIIGRRILGAVRAGDEPELFVPVLAYMLVISAMVASAFGTTRWFAIVGAVLFYASDSLIAWNKFIDEKPWGPMAIIVTYHLGQICLVASLAT